MFENNQHGFSGLSALDYNGAVSLIVEDAEDTMNNLLDALQAAMSIDDVMNFDDSLKVNVFSDEFYDLKISMTTDQFKNLISTAFPNYYHGDWDNLSTKTEIESAINDCSVYSVITPSGESVSLCRDSATSVCWITEMGDESPYYVRSDFMHMDVDSEGEILLIHNPLWAVKNSHIQGQIGYVSDYNGFEDIIESITNAYSSNDVVARIGGAILSNDTISLEKISAACSDIMDKLTGDALLTYQNFISNASSLDTGSFLTVVKAMYDSFDAATPVVDGKLHFNENDYTVKTFAFTARTVITTVAQFAVVIGSAFGPIGTAIGFVISAVSTLFNYATDLTKMTVNYDSKNRKVAFPFGQAEIVSPQPYVNMTLNDISNWQVFRSDIHANARIYHTDLVIYLRQHKTLRVSTPSSILYYWYYLDEDSYEHMCFEGYLTCSLFCLNSKRAETSDYTFQLDNGMLFGRRNNEFIFNQQETLFNNQSDFAGLKYVSDLGASSLSTLTADDGNVLASLTYALCSILGFQAEIALRYSKQSWVIDDCLSISKAKMLELTNPYDIMYGSILLSVTEANCSVQDTNGSFDTHSISWSDLVSTCQGLCGKMKELCNPATYMVSSLQMDLLNPFYGLPNFVLAANYPSFYSVNVNDKDQALISPPSWTVSGLVLSTIALGGVVAGAVVGARALRNVYRRVISRSLRRRLNKVESNKLLFETTPNFSNYSKYQRSINRYNRTARLTGASTINPYSTQQMINISNDSINSVASGVIMLRKLNQENEEKMNDISADIADLRSIVENIKNLISKP